MKIIKKVFSAVVMLVALFVSACGGLNNVSAMSFSISPMKEKIVLIPGQTFHGSLKVTNPATNEEDFEFKASVTGISFDENYNMSLDETEKYSDIIKWTKIENPTATIKPNETATVYFNIDVPQNAPAGAQYEAITVSTVAGEGSGKLNIQQNVQMAHIIYANVAGETVYDTKVTEMNLPAFLFGGNLSATAMVKNSGNAYADAEHILQVFPLFSNEEIYTNEEDPNTTVVLPESVRLANTTWYETPSIGIFNVRYTVKIDGETAGSIEKLVIICPVWLLIVVVIAIAMLIIWIIVIIKKRNKKAANSGI